MDAVQTRLRRLRTWFVVWFVVQSAAGTVIAAAVVDGLRRFGPLRYGLGSVSAEFTIAAGVLGSLVVLGLALLVAAALLQRRPWARLVFLIYGWLAVVDAVVSLTPLSQAGGWLGSLGQISGGDWAMLQAAGTVAELIDLVSWSWVIHTLQFDATVRAAFVCPAPEGVGAGRSA